MSFLYSISWSCYQTDSTSKQLGGRVTQKQLQQKTQGIFLYY